jgi:hypothetical protein
MKRIEAVITPWALDTFKETVSQLGISEFELVKVYCSGCESIEGGKRIYRGLEFKADLSPAGAARSLCSMTTFRRLCISYLNSSIRKAFRYLDWTRKFVQSPRHTLIRNTASNLKANLIFVRQWRQA